MKPIQVLIVDDEPLAQELLEVHVSMLPQYALAGKCNNVPEALALMRTHHIDLLLLDINMPEITGIEMLRAIKNPPMVIFTTAYSEYAVESYDLDAVDYLLKPVTFERFAVAMKKAEELINIPAASASNISLDNNTIFVRTDGKMRKINLNELHFVEGYKNYVRLWLGNEKIIVHNTMKNFEEYLSTNPWFLRISKSYIVNLKYISSVQGNYVSISGQALVIGNTFKEEVLRTLEQYKLT